MSNENLSKISEFGIWLIQWFGDFSKDIKVLQIRTLNSIIRFLVAPLLKDFKFGKSMKTKHFRDFLFPKTPTFLAKLCSSVGLNRDQFRS